MDADSPIPPLVLALVFIVGTLVVGMTASGLSAKRPYLMAMAAGVVFEAALLALIRPGLSPLALAIAFGAAASFAALGAWISRRMKS